MLITFPVSILNITFSGFFFPSTLNEWNNLDINARNSESYVTFERSILRFIRSSENSTINCHNPSGRITKLITRLRMGFSHLREHKFKHNFQDKLNRICSCEENIKTTTHCLQDTLNPICSCEENIETTTYYLLHCLNF